MYAVAINVRCSTQPESPLARIRRQSPRVSPSCTRVFGPIDAIMRDWRVGFDRTTAQLRATDVTQPRVFARAVDLGAGAARVVVALGGAFAIVRGVDLDVGARAVGGGTVRARVGTGALGAAGLGVLATVRGAAFSTGLAVMGSGGRAAGVSTAEGTESFCTTVPADCIATRWGTTTGVETVGVVSTVDKAIAVSPVESATVTTVESTVPAVAESGRASAIFRPNDSDLG